MSAVAGDSRPDIARRYPLVTLGVPVRNGAAMLRAALDSIVVQDYPNIEVVISDNASTDETAEIVRDYAARHTNIRVIRQPMPLGAIDNFMFVLREARGAFFAWCAHDDTRSPNFVSGLLTAFDDPGVLLAFGDLYIWNGVDEPKLRFDYDFDNERLSRWRRLRKTANMQCYHFYGLWRTDALRAVPYRHTRWWPDLPIMLGAVAAGVFRHVPGVAFNYYEVTKSAAERAHYQDNAAPATRLINLWDVLRGSALTVARVAGAAMGLLACVFVIEKFSRQLVRRYWPRWGTSHA